MFIRLPFFILFSKLLNAATIAAHRTAISVIRALSMGNIEITVIVCKIKRLQLFFLHAVIGRKTWGKAGMREREFKDGPNALAWVARLNVQAPFSSQGAGRAGRQKCRTWRWEFGEGKASMSESVSFLFFFLWMSKFWRNLNLRFPYTWRVDVLG